MKTSAANASRLSSLAAIAAIAAFVPAAVAASPTKVVEYQAAHMAATATYAGSCEGRSHLSAQHDAYRCHAPSHGRYDPCFAEGTSTVACPINVLKNTGVAITVTALPPASPSDPAPKQPWAMKLTQGQFCIHAPGFTGLHGYGYSCGTIACAAPALAPLERTYEANCTAVAATKPQPRPFFVATIYK